MSVDSGQTNVVVSLRPEDGSLSAHFSTKDSQNPALTLTVLEKTPYNLFADLPFFSHIYEFFELFFIFLLFFCPQYYYFLILILLDFHSSTLSVVATFYPLS